MFGLNPSSQEWKEFVRRCAAAVDAGISDREFSQELVGQQVMWAGKIERLDLKKGAIVPGIAITMPWVEIPLKNGKSFVGSYLFLKLSAGPNRTKQKAIGDAVAFSGKFPRQGVFPCVNFDIDDEQQKVFLSMTLEEGEVIG